MADKSLYLTDGALDFVGGVDSGKIPLLQSTDNPNGLRRDQVAWLVNGTVRGGGITQRAGWKYLTTIADGTALYQGGYLYEPKGGTPRLIVSIGGHILKLETDPGAPIIDLSVANGIFNPATVEEAFFQQAEEFLIIQAGDYGLHPPPYTLPIFTDTHSLFRRSHGLDPPTGGSTVPGAANINEIPAALQMDYYMGRLWYAQDRITSAGDIVGGPTGSVAWEFRDALLRVTENPLAIGGDGFPIPTHDGGIRALAHAAAIDTALGQGQLFVFTRKKVYSLSVPVTRADWTSTTEPLQKVVQIKYGTSSNRSVVAVNGDLFYQTLEPGTRSLALAVRYFNQWANTAISRNINRVLNLTNRGLMRFSSGMLFDNRLWHTVMPFQTTVGVAHSAIAVLDFDLISSFQDKLAGAPIPSWEGVWQGLDVLQLFSGDYGGLERAFAVVRSQKDGTIQLWEMSLADRFENGDNRVRWVIETPAYPFGDPFALKELQASDLWIDRLYGEVDILVEYRTDDDPCWHWWIEFRQCSARNSCEDLANPICYPIEVFGESNRKPLTLPHPPPKECMSNGRGPAYIGHYFQLRITITGFCRYRGTLIYGTRVDRPLHLRPVC